ncbi:hypothetical protein [Snuella sedimenti]|uniref:Beta-carotene 15,15'-monooxygenase n=1 Tax=Snuella sedimenti TaxID=2798802 RepID=A0A8J7IHZ0_9FLAO|nr:hypothetical protein [Snuella sedimenti]MBJ6368521.1 hypothetical protein [Snuella sedimenti]
MDELELLKKDWNKENGGFTKKTTAELYAMLHKKSSSIVKTLFYISVAELLFWIVINSIPYMTSEEYQKKLNTIYDNEFLFTGLTVLSYGIILLFIYLLFTSYRSISVTDSAKKLMESILKTRKIIKYYVLYNLIMAGFSLIIGFYFAFKHNPAVSGKFSHLGNMELIVTTIVIIVFITVFILVIWFFYRIIYGLLLKRLNRNYNELKKLEF